MTNQIYDPPQHTSAGQDFNYDRWSAGSIIKLANVPWDSAYRDVVMFDKPGDVNTYIDRHASTVMIDSLFQIKPSAPYVELDIAYNAALKFNYLRVYNPAQPVHGDYARSFYYFVRDVEYRSPNSTRLYLQLDVWQSFIYDINILSGYLVRGHYAAKAAHSDWRYNMIPEPYDTGSSYIATSDVYSQTVINSINTAAPQQSSYYILITATQALEASPVDKDGHPKITSAFGALVQGMLTPTSVYAMDISDYLNYMLIASAYPHIQQSIVDVRLYPKSLGIGARLPRNVNLDGYMWPPGATGAGTTDGFLRSVPDKANQVIAYPKLTDYRGKIRAALKSAIPAHMHWAVDRFTKFLTAPYSFIEFHSNQGETTTLQPEGWGADDINVTARCSIAPGDVSMTFNSDNYLLDRGVSNLYTINGMPQLPIINNNAGIALASQARSMQHARASAAWGNDRSAMLAQGAYHNSGIERGAARQMGGITAALDAENVAAGNEHAQNTAWLSAASQVIGGTAMGGLAGGGAGAGIGLVGGGLAAAGTAISTGMNADFANKQLASRTAASGAMLNVQNDASRAVADNNRALAGRAAQGDYANTIAGLDAKAQDTMMIPPSLSGQFGGALNVIAKFGELALKARIRHVNGEAIVRHINMWSRYGYLANAFIEIDTLKVMTKFSYWQLMETYIDSSNATANESLLLAIRGILEKGVTVWSRPEYVGRYDFEGNRFA